MKVLLCTFWKVLNEYWLLKTTVVRVVPRIINQKILYSQFSFLILLKTYNT